MAFCLLALTLAGTFLGLAVAQFSQDPPASHLDVLHSERSIMEFLGSKSPFESHSDTYSLVDVPEQCRLVHLSHIVRHGSRFSKSLTSLHRLKAVIIAAGEHLQEEGEQLSLAIEQMRIDENMGTGSLASHAKSEALRTVGPLWNAYMSDFSNTLAYDRKIVVESTPSQRCITYASRLVEAIEFVAPVENGSFVAVPGTSAGLLMQIQPADEYLSHDAWTRSGILRPYKACRAAAAARRAAKEILSTAQLEQGLENEHKSTSWFTEEVQPYQQLSALTPLELRKLLKKRTSSKPGHVEISSDGSPVQSDEPAERALPKTREEALLLNVFSQSFLDELPTILTEEQCTQYTWGSPRDCAIATVAWDLFQVCRMDAAGYGLSKGVCNIWKSHIPLMEKFDYMQDTILLHTKGYYSKAAVGATCPLLEDMFEGVDASMHASKRNTSHTPTWRSSSDNYWLPGSAKAPAAVTDERSGVRLKQPWAAKQARGPAWNLRVTHAGTLVPLFALLGLQEHPFLPTLRERYHVYSREPVPPGAAPVNFTRTMAMHRYNRLVALAYGFEDPPESLSSAALVPKVKPGSIPPPPPPMPQAPQDQSEAQGGGNRAFDPAMFAPGFDMKAGDRASPEELRDLNLANTRLGIAPETHDAGIPPPVGSQPRHTLKRVGMVDEADLNTEVLNEQAAKARIRAALQAAEDPEWGITKLGELHGMEYMQHLPKDYVKIMSMYMKGIAEVGASAFKHPLTASRLVPMGGNFGMALYECGGDPESRHPRVRDAPVKYRVSAMVHGRQVPFPACPISLYCDLDAVKKYYREQVYPSLSVGQCSPKDVQQMCDSAPLDVEV